MTGQPAMLIVAPTAKKQLAQQLPQPVASAAYEFIVSSLVDAPHRVGTRLQEPLGELHNARRGTYRVLYHIDDQRHRVAVVGVFSRSEADRGQ